MMSIFERDLVIGEKYHIRYISNMDKRKAKINDFYGILKKIDKFLNTEHFYLSLKPTPDSPGFSEYYHESVLSSREIVEIKLVLSGSTLTESGKLNIIRSQLKLPSKSINSILERSSLTHSNLGEDLALGEKYQFILKDKYAKLNNASGPGTRLKVLIGILVDYYYVQNTEAGYLVIDPTPDFPEYPFYNFRFILTTDMIESLEIYNPYGSQGTEDVSLTEESRLSMIKDQVSTSLC